MRGSSSGLHKRGFGKIELDRKDAFLIISAIYTDTASLKAAKPHTLRYLAEIMENYNSEKKVEKLWL